MSRAISRPILSRSGWFMAHSGGAMEATQLIALLIEFPLGQSRSLEFSAQIGIFMPPGVPGGCFIFFRNHLEAGESDKYWPRNGLIRPGFNLGGCNFEGTKFGLIVDVLGTIDKPHSIAFKRPTNHKIEEVVPTILFDGKGYEGKSGVTYLVFCTGINCEIATGLWKRNQLNITRKLNFSWGFPTLNVVSRTVYDQNTYKQKGHQMTHMAVAQTGTLTHKAVLRGARRSEVLHPLALPFFTYHPPTLSCILVSASSLALPATTLNYTVLGSETVHTTLEPALADLRQAGAAGAATLYMTDNAVVASHVATGVAPTEANRCAQTTAACAELVAQLTVLDVEEKAAVAAYESAEVECTVYEYDSDDNYWQD
ncbi:hypothetical protein C8R45DRAFT_934361 [Mycena sanguinolenta]|nr:hypothetical protein C8R45DRAFT_934361 [Mycena sanguinolenta]